MNSISQPCETINLDDLYIHAGNYSRKFKQVLNNLQAKFDKDPDSTVAYIDALASATVTKNSRRSKSKNKTSQKKIKDGQEDEEEDYLIGTFNFDDVLYCLKCKKHTKNKPEAQVFYTGKNIRIRCQCETCGSGKSKFSKCDKLPEDLKTKAMAKMNKMNKMKK